MRRELYLTCEKAKGGISFANSDDRRCEGHVRRDSHNGLFRRILTENIITHIELLDFKFTDVHSMDRKSQFMRKPRTRSAASYPP